ncbi:MAG TPA: RMD1 family protein [Stellaceae bacterium]|nr:RMD1 family protein [Stellaceae bacterium]
MKAAKPLSAPSKSGMGPRQQSAAPASEARLQTIAVHALLLGERLDTRTLEGGTVLATAPLADSIEGGGIAIVFRYGAIVLFESPAAATERFLAKIDPLLTDKLAVAEHEDLHLLVGGDSDQLVDAAGNIMLRDRTIERLQLVADVLAKNLVLAHYETQVAAIFDRIEPLAAALRNKGRAGAPGKVLLQHIGNVLLMQQKMVGRVETAEKPELVWEHPELDRLYMRLAEEYELRERARAIDRKLEIVSRTVETLLSLEQTRSSLRVEWYIVALIVAELALAAYSLLPAH